MSAPDYDYSDQPYLAELLRHVAEGKLETQPGLYHVMIEHDDWCPLLLGTGPCICSPVVRNPNRKERRRLRALYGAPVAASGKERGP